MHWCKKTLIVIGAFIALGITFFAGYGASCIGGYCGLNPDPATEEPSVEQRQTEQPTPIANSTGSHELPKNTSEYLMFRMDEMKQNMTKMRQKMDEKDSSLEDKLNDLDGRVTALGLKVETQKSTATLKEANIPTTLLLFALIVHWFVHNIT